MGVYIKGMEMPECCGYCPFEYKNYCMAKPSLKVESADRHPRCPLVPVPPHGDLIDRDALIADLKRQCKEVFRVNAVSPDDFWITRNEAYNERLWGTWCESFYGYLQTRPTVIPVEGGET